MGLVAVVVLAAATVVACVGWGRLLLALVGRLGAAPPLPDVPTGVAGGLGLAVTLLAPGPLVAADAFHVAFGVPWLLVGVAAVVVRAARRRPRPALLPAGVLAGALAAAGAFLLVHATRLVPVNLCDDEASYIPLADRLAETGGLIEPFSQRRVGTFGGLATLQAVGNSMLGAENAFVADVLVGGMLAVLLLLPSRAGAGRLLLGAGLAGCFLLWESGRNNLSPAYLVVALLGTGALLAMQLRRAGVAPLDLRFAVLLGVLAGGLLTLRVNHALPMLLLGVLLALTARAAPWRARVAAAALIAAVTATLVLPWSIALWRSSGTPLFPLVAGNVDREWPGFRDPGTTTPADVARELAAVLAEGEVAWLVAGTAVALAAAWVLARSGRAALAGPLLLAPAAVAAAAAVVVTVTAFLPVDLARLTWPVLAGALLAALVALADVAAQATGARRAMGGAVALAVALVLALPLHDARRTVADTAAAARATLAGSPGRDRPWDAAAGDYRAAQAAVPAGARIAVAADFPHLLDLDRNDAVTLDIVGHVSPPPGLPFFAGPQAKATYLRAQGLEFLVATDPGASACLWSRRTWSSGAALEEPYVLWAPWFEDWFTTVDALAAGAAGPVARFGSLLVVDLRGSARRVPDR